MVCYTTSANYIQSIIQSYNQNMKEKDIILVRRDTGGGAVYVDNGAVNVCFLMPGGYRCIWKLQKNSTNQQ